MSSDWTEDKKHLMFVLWYKTSLLCCVSRVFRRSRWRRAVKFSPRGRIHRLRSTCSSFSSTSPTLMSSWREKLKLTSLKWDRTPTGTFRLAFHEAVKWQSIFLDHIEVFMALYWVAPSTVTPDWSKMPLHRTVQWVTVCHVILLFYDLCNVTTYYYFLLYYVIKQHKTWQHHRKHNMFCCCFGVFINQH